MEMRKSVIETPNRYAGLYLSQIYTNNNGIAWEEPRGGGGGVNLLVDGGSRGGYITKHKARDIVLGPQIGSIDPKLETSGTF